MAYTWKHRDAKGRVKVEDNHPTRGTNFLEVWISVQDDNDRILKRWTTDDRGEMTVEYHAEGNEHTSKYPLLYYNMDILTVGKAKVYSRVSRRILRDNQT